MSENSFQINGDGFTNQTIKLGIKASDFESNYYAKSSYNYFQDYQNMTLRISGANNNSTAAPITGMHIDFNSFTKPGRYTTDSAISFSLFFKKDIPSDEHELHYILENGEITIQTYEPVGGLIEGTFSGTFSKLVYNKLTNTFDETDKTVSVSNGKFSVIHNPDYHWDAPVCNAAEPEGFKKKKKHR